MDSIVNFLRTPPGWMLSLLLVIIVTHLLKLALRLPSGGVIGVLEFFAVVVVGGLMAHSFLAPDLVREDHATVNPSVFLFVFVFLTLASAIVYIVDRRTPSG